jgi:hypothetical protein
MLVKTANERYFLFDMLIVDGKKIKYFSYLGQITELERGNKECFNLGLEELKLFNDAQKLRDKSCAFV